MLNELKRIWRNYKYYFIFLFVIEILLLIEFKAERIISHSGGEYKLFFGTFIQMFTLVSFFFFNHFKTNLNDFELVQPFARIKTFLYRNILFITYFFTLYILKNLFILKINEFYNWIPNLFICLLFIVTIYIYFMNFRKYFLIYTSIIITLYIFFFLIFGILYDDVFLSLTISVIKNIISIFLIIILYPLFMYLFNYVKNLGYQKSIIKRLFFIITFLLLLSFLLPILSVSRCKVYVPINYSGYITFRSPMFKPKFVRMFNSSTYKYYSIEEKQFIKRDNSKSILFKNKYGIIIESISNQVTLATNDFDMLCYTVPRLNEMNFDDINNLGYIYAYTTGNKIYKINLTNFEIELVFENAKALYSYRHFYKFQRFRTEDGDKYVLTYKDGLVKIKLHNYRTLKGIDEIYYYDKKKNEVLDFDGNLIYKLEEGEKVKGYPRAIIYNEDESNLKLLFKRKLIEIPSDYNFINNKFAYYYIEEDKIVLKNLEDNTVIAEFSSNDSSLRSLKYAIITSSNNNYYLYIHKHSKIPFSRLYNKSRYYSAWEYEGIFENSRDCNALEYKGIFKNLKVYFYWQYKYGKILIYKVVDGKFELYDTIK